MVEAIHVVKDGNIIVSTALTSANASRASNIYGIPAAYIRGR